LLKIPFTDVNCLNKKVSTSRKLDAVEEQAFWDLRYYLPDDLLVKVDRASMQYSLEVRVPLLDYRLIEFAFNLHRNLKMKNGEMKYFLKEVLYDFLPRKLFDRPKWGFSIPLKNWLKKDLSYLLSNYTSKEVIEKYGFLDYLMVERMIKRYLKGQDYLFNRIWAIIVLHWWLEEQETA
jgi:asparagine synthase (glutamine-hydrolysing)